MLLRLLQMTALLFVYMLVITPSYKPTSPPHPPGPTQIIVRHGHAIEPRLQAALRSCPPSVWRPAIPQLLAQLQQASPPPSPLPTSPSATTTAAATAATTVGSPSTTAASLTASAGSAASRRLLLGLLLAVAGASPHSVLYPCVVEARVAESSEQALGAEMQVREGGGCTTPAWSVEARVAESSGQSLGAEMQVRGVGGAGALASTFVHTSIHLPPSPCTSDPAAPP